MKKLILILLLPVLLSAVFISCKQKEAETVDINSLVSKFSDLECRAFTLREQRYSLADKIRFTEDSISKAAKIPAAKKDLQTHLDGYLKDKATILSLSLRLADTIKLQLDSITKIKLQSREKISLFDKALSLELAKRQCR